MTPKAPTLKELSRFLRDFEEVYGWRPSLFAASFDAIKWVLDISLDIDCTFDDLRQILDGVMDFERYLSTIPEEQRKRERQFIQAHAAKCEENWLRWRKMDKRHAEQMQKWIDEGQPS